MWNTIVTWLHKKLYSDTSLLLHSAIESFEGDISLVKSLLQQDSSQVNVRNSKDETPLHLAVQNYRCSEKLIELLVEYGADVRATNARDGNTALHYCCKRMPVRRDHIIKILVRHGSNVNARNLEGNTPLHIALLEEKFFVTNMTLLRCGSDAGLVNCKGDTPLHLCLREDGETTGRFSWFLDKTADVNVVDANGETPLHLAVRNRERAKALFIKMLLDRGADVSKKDAKGENAYQAYCRAVAEDHRRKLDPMLQILLQSKEQEYMDSSLHVASLFHRVESVRKLLDMGADVNAVDESGFPPIYYALIALGDVDKCSTLRLLLDYGADINQQFNRSNAEIVDWNNGSDEASILEAAKGGLWVEIVDEHLRVGNVFLEHLSKLLALREKQLEKGIDLDEVLSEYNRVLLRVRLSIENLDFYLSGVFDKHDDWPSLSSEELKAMSETEVGESRLSFLDLLLASAEETAKYAMNKELVEAFHSKKAMFPMYQGMLDAKFARNLERRKLLENAAVAMSHALKFANPSDEFFERTLSYCSNEDLVHVIEAME